MFCYQTPHVMMCRQGQCRQYDQEQTTMTESELRLLRSLRGPACGECST